MRNREPQRQLKFLFYRIAHMLELHESKDKNSQDEHEIRILENKPRSKYTC